MKPYLYNHLKKRKLYINFPDGGKWVRGWLKETVGPRKQMKWIRMGGDIWWELSRNHYDAVLKGLRRRYQSVITIDEYRRRQKCTSSCQTAGETICECCCLGEFHGGTTHKWKAVIGDYIVSDELRRVTREWEGEKADIVTETTYSL